MIIQFILSGILGLALLMTWRRFRQGAIRWLEVLGWTLVWSVALLMTWRPEFSTSLAHWVGIGRGVDLIAYGSVILVFILVFHLYVVHDRLERQLTELIRRDALQRWSEQNTQQKEVDPSKDGLSSV